MNGKTLRPFKIQNTRYGSFRDKVIYTTIDPISPTWIERGIKNCKYLLSYLSDKFGGIDKFELILVGDDELNDDFLLGYGEHPNWVVIRIFTFVRYGYDLKRLIDDLEVSKQYLSITREVGIKVPKSYFARKSAEVLFKEFNLSTFAILENIVKNFDKLDEEGRKQVLKILEASGIEREILENFGRLEVKDPERQVKLFLKALDKIGEEKLESILKHLMRSKKTVSLFEKVRLMGKADQIRIAKNIDSILGIASRYEEINSSLKAFKKLIQEHERSETKNEAEIHEFLLNNYWLLGPEYFDRPVKSSIKAGGTKSRETGFWSGKLFPDLEIQKLDGTFDALVFEFEEANDPIFMKNGKLSPKVMDGINQAQNYVLFKRLSGEYPKGIAVIGSLTKPKKKQLEQLRKLAAGVNVEILTYQDIMTRAENFIKFYEERIQ